VLPSTVEHWKPLLVEDGQIKYLELSTDRKAWHDLFLWTVPGRQRQTIRVSLSTRGRTLRPIVEAEVGR
jgi:hypothetical protein